MKKILLMMSLCIFLLTAISASSFFLPEYLTNLITRNEHNESQLKYALEQKNLSALEYAFKHSLLHSEQWLDLAKTLAKTQGEIAYQLAVYHHNSPTKKFFWLNNASRLSYHQATLVLATNYFEQDDLIEAEKLLSEIPLANSDVLEKIKLGALKLKMNIAINKGQINHVESILSKHTTLLSTTETGNTFLENIKKYRIVDWNKAVFRGSNSKLTCENSIQLFATRMAHLKQVNKMIEDFKTQPLNNVICFAPARYLPINTLDCSDNKHEAIRCDESNWVLIADTIDARYVGIMLPQGGANVHLGMLYFDSHDTVDVVAHEVSHLLGFVDEYPLKADHIACQTPQKAPFSQNIAVLKNTYQGDRKTIRAEVLDQLVWSKHIKNSTPILQLVTNLNGIQHWQLGTPLAFQHEVGLFNAKTCDENNVEKGSSFSAYKGISRRTQLQYFSLSFPPLYSQLLQESAINYRMPSFHYNIALAYFQKMTSDRDTSLQLLLQQQALNKSHLALANYWLEHAAKWETNLERRNKIRQGNF